MTPRAGGAEVQRLTRAFSDRLLVEERVAFNSIQMTYRAGAKQAQAGVVRSLGKTREVKRLRTNAAATTRLVNLHAECARAAGARIETLVETATRMAATAIRAELQVCEQVLDDERYDGLANAAVRVAQDEAEALRTSVLARVSGETAGATVRFRSDARGQMAAEPDADRLLRRLFSEEPAGLRGFGGMGVWYRGASDLKAVARGCSIEAANRLRQQAMQAFNDLGVERRNG